MTPIHVTYSSLFVVGSVLFTAASMIPLFHEERDLPNAIMNTLGGIMFVVGSWLMYYRARKLDTPTEETQAEQHLPRRQSSFASINEHFHRSQQTVDRFGFLVALLFFVGSMLFTISAGRVFSETKTLTDWLNIFGGITFIAGSYLIFYQKQKPEEAENFYSKHFPHFYRKKITPFVLGYALLFAVGSVCFTLASTLYLIQQDPRDIPSILNALGGGLFGVGSLMLFYRKQKKPTIQQDTATNMELASA